MNISSLPGPFSGLAGEYKTLKEICLGLWDFAHAHGRNGRLTFRDLVVFHKPANMGRLLGLIDKNGDQDMGLHVIEEEVLQKRVVDRPNSRAPVPKSSEPSAQKIQASEENGTVPSSMPIALWSVISNQQFLGKTTLIIYILDY